MREIKDLASSIKEAIAGLKKTAESTKASFHSEVERAVINADKLRSFTVDLRDANAEMESVLGETNSNFPTSEKKSESLPKHTDINGVTLNPETENK